MTQLSPHFTLEQLTRSDTAIRLGIDNTPSPSEQNNLVLLCSNVLEPVYQEYIVVRNYPRVIINSGFRSMGLNMAINPMTTTLTKVSKHCYGQAVDFEVDGVSNYDLAVWCRDNIPQYDQIILEFYTPGQPNSGWVHVSWVLSVNGQRKQTLTAARSVDPVTKKSTTKYLQGFTP